MVGKILLPWLGGTPAVWNTCMVFFQALLLAGYAYAHFLSQRFELKKQWWIHGIVLAVSLIPLVLLRFDAGRIAQFSMPPEERSPIPWLLGVLFLSAGLPFFAVAATAPLLQRWFSNTKHPDANDPYFLYGASNLGSMVALLSYPFLIEPRIGVQQQTLYWVFGFVGMAVMILASGILALRNPKDPTPSPSSVPLGVEAPKPSEAQTQKPAPGLFDFMGWAILGMVPSSLMLGVTTHVTTDIAAIPLLWILPLTIYLLTFILVFSRIPVWLTAPAFLAMGLYYLYFYRFGIDFDLYLKEKDYFGLLQQIFLYSVSLKFVDTLAFALGLLGVVYGSKSFIAQHNLMVLLLPLAIFGGVFIGDIKEYLGLTEIEVICVHFFLLFVVAMVCHGELARTRPDSAHLTYFYMAMSTGGVLGGIFNTILAPVLFVGIVEYPLIAVLACLMIPEVDFGTFKTKAGQVVSKTLEFGTRSFLFVFGLLIGAFLILVHFLPVEKAKDSFVFKKYNLENTWIGQKFLEKLGDNRAILYRVRNFFGTFQIERVSDGQGNVYHKLLHGTTNHGMQIVEPSSRKRDTVTYFHKDGAIGQLFETMREKAKAKGRPLNVGVLGIGTGTLAAYMEEGWNLDLYEIDPAVVTVATKEIDLGDGKPTRIFSFIPDAIDRKVAVNIKLGDGRRSMSKAEDEKYDLIFMDAFTSDAVPVHLLTKEAFEMYFSKLQPDGIVVINIANRYLRFEPVLGNLAEDLGIKAMYQHGFEVRDLDKYGTNWVVMARNKEAFASLPDKKNEFDYNGESWTESWKDLPPVRFSESKVWTDDYSNLPSILR